MAVRVSTAGAGKSDAVGHLLGQLPSGLVLNVGSGTTGATDGAQRLVNVDHVAPEGDRPPGLIVVADAHHLPFAAASFDAVLAKDVLEHVEDPIAVLRELGRTARPAAAIVAVVPRAIARAVWDDPTHVRDFTKRAIVTALEHGGWRPTEQVHRLGGFPGAGRLGLIPHLETLMRLPGFGHWFGRNWIARAEVRP